MNILVAISNVPDTTTKIQFSDSDTKFNSAGVTFIINPYDEWYALVRALELKEAGKAQKVTLIHVGLSDSEATIRKGLALGADDAVRIDGDAPDAYYVAENISNYAKGFLKENGTLYFEINERAGDKMYNMLSLNGFNEVKILKDLSGKNRFAVCKK